LVAEFYPIRDPQKIPSVMCPDEIERLLAEARTLRLRAMLSLAYGCVLRIVACNLMISKLLQNISEASNMVHFDHVMNHVLSKSKRS
jgi:site-specific recombinase XerD